MTVPSARARRLSLAQLAQQTATHRVHTPEGLAAARRALLSLAAQARASDDRRAYIQIISVMVGVRSDWAAEQARQAAAALKDKRRPTGADPITAWYARELGEWSALDAAPAQQLRERQQFQRPLAPTGLSLPHQRDRDRLAANMLAHALWAIHQGERDWTPIPTKPVFAQAHAPKGEAGGSAVGPSRLTVQVPEGAYGDGVTVHLYRSDYERLLDSWGYHRVTRARRLTHSLRASGAPGAELDALRDLALSAAPHPNLALAWHAYVSSPRLGDVFAPHSSGSMQLAPRRNGDLREAALAIHAEAEQLPCAQSAPASTG